MERTVATANDESKACRYKETDTNQTLEPTAMVSDGNEMQNDSVLCPRSKKQRHSVLFYFRQGGMRK